MKIAIMMRSIDQDSGFRVYVEGLVESLLRFEDEHTYLLLYRTPKWLGRFASFPKAKEILVRAPHKFFWDQVAVPYRSWKERADVIFHPKFSVPFVAHCPVVMGLQEPAWWAWPEHCEHSNVMYQKLMLPLSCRRAAHLFPMAYWILEENRRHLRLPLRDATVTWPAPHEYLQPIEDRAALQEFKERWHSPQPVSIGCDARRLFRDRGLHELLPGKNPQTALRAFLQIRDRIPHHICGVPHCDLEDRGLPRSGGGCGAARRSLRRRRCGGEDPAARDRSRPA
jgi:hypothetical protein